jgi:hypothetical protein
MDDCHSEGGQFRARHFSNSVERDLEVVGGSRRQRDKEWHWLEGCREAEVWEERQVTIGAGRHSLNTERALGSGNLAGGSL